MKSLFEYMNYRDYLREAYEDKKQKSPFYSYRLFSQKAGFKSPNFLKLVIDNQRNITKESAFRFSKAFGHNKREAEFFENLVFFNQAKTLEEKNAYLSKVMKYRVKSDDLHKIEASEYSYLSKWYHPVVLELASAVDFKDDYKKLAQMLVPPITAIEAEKSVALLLDLKFLRKKEDGAYEATSTQLSTGFQVRSIGVANYHKSMIAMASEAIERFPSTRRDISSVTIGISRETYKTIISRTQQFAMELMQIADADKNREMVAQVNLQVFPLSQDFPAKEANNGQV
jgi:uncharacterized protein (TIGR02147 family)